MDQADEEFFDNLVGDEGNNGGLINKKLDEDDGSNLVNKELDEAKTLVNNCTDVVTSERLDLKGNVESGFNAENVEMEDGGMDSSRNCNVVNAMEVKELEDKKSGENLRKEASIKEVDWSAFNFGGNGTGSCSDFFNELDGSSENLFGNVENHSGFSSENVSGDAGGTCRYTSSVGFGQNQGQNYWLGSEQAVTGQDQSIQYWESLYPGWKYDVNTGQWFQLEGYSGTDCSVPNCDYSNNNNNNNDGLVNSNVVTTQQSNLSYYHQTCHSDGTVSNYNQGSQISDGYPTHMLFDPQYPDWYYDSIAQEWQPLQSYTAALIPPQVDNQQLSQNVNLSTVESTQGNNHNSYGNIQEPAAYCSPSLKRNDQSMHWCGTTSDNQYHNFNNSRLQHVPQSEATNFAENELLQNSYSSNYYACNSADQQNPQTWHEPSVTATSYEHANEYGTVESFNPDQNLYSHFNEQKREASQQRQFSSSSIDNMKTPTSLQKPAQNGSQSISTSSEGRSSAGRPPHALVSFAFGGKLIVMKDYHSLVTNSQSGQVISSPRSLFGQSMLFIVKLLNLFGVYI